MLTISNVLAEEFSIKLNQVQNALELFNEGATVPFVARYRKERTGGLNEIQLRDISDRYTYLTELEERKETILKSIDEQGKLSEELKEKIERCLKKNELEDLYLPYKPKKKTRATQAIDKGLQPLSETIKSLNKPNVADVDLITEAAKYVSEEKGVQDAEAALKGASDILAEEIAENADYRAYLRDYFSREGVFVTKVKDEFQEGSTKFEMYRNYSCKVSDIKPHNMLAIRRGESEGVLNFTLEFEADVVEAYLKKQVIKTTNESLVSFLSDMLRDAFDRLMKTALTGEVRFEQRLKADEESIKTFEANLKELLLSSPAGMKPTLGIDPGFRTGCKVVVISKTGTMLEHQTIYPHNGESAQQEAEKTLVDLCNKYGIELIAIGNGTAGRETDEFAKQAIAKLERKLIKVMVNESGASVYSASKVAIEEFPELDVTIRGAISIARRLQDPLAELVKIEPKSIGVGQYQHDVDQKLLKKKLEETVESCVNYVGVDLNTASKELLGYVSGVNATIAKNVVAYREKHGEFKNRQELLAVEKYGPKTFEQSAGFLRIRNGENPLDNTAVHPESYAIVESITSDLSLPLDQITANASKLSSVDVKKYVTDTVGEPTLLDILEELKKPGRDPREEFRYAEFDDNVKTMNDLSPGMILEGVVTNVTDFGAFVDIGVHHDGLVHVSELANQYVKDPKEAVKVGQIVKVRVLDVNLELQRISLSMRSEPAKGSKRKSSKDKRKSKQPPKQKTFTLDDLKAKFNSK